jgi:putative ABC transport system permease protein
MWTRTRLWIGTLVGRNRFEGELAEELAFHLQARVDSLHQRGVEPVEARRRARIEFGNPERVEEHVRDVRMGMWFEPVRQDLGYGVRLMRRDPGLSCGIVAILAVALGFATAIWSFADKSLLRPLPFEDAGRLVWLRGGDTQRGFERLPISYQDFRDWRERSRRFDDIAAWQNQLRVRSDAAFPERVRAAAATDNLYGLLGAIPLLGSLPRSATEAVLSHGYWNGRFNADPDVVGSTVRLEDTSFTIVGVLPERFAFPPFPAEYRPEVWVSLEHAVDATGRSDRWRSLWAVGRLAPGVGLDGARIEMDAIARDLEREYPETNRAAGVSMGPLADLWGDRLQATLPTMLLGAALALLVACSNVTGLLVSRALRRRPEFLLRAALGAGTLRLARQLATEVGLLFVAGAAGGLALAHVALPLLVRQFSQGGSYLSATPTVDARVFLVMALVAGTAGLLTSLGLLAGARPGRGSSSLRANHAHATGRSRWRRGLLVAQTGISMVVIFAGALLTESLRTAATEPVGFDMANLLALRIETPVELGSEPRRMTNLLRQVAERADLATPGNPVALAYAGPFGSRGSSRFFEVARRPVADAVQPPLAGYRLVSRNYFEVLGIRLLRGQGLPAASEGVLPVVVNQTFVNRHLGGEDPIGARLRFFSALQERLDRSQATAAEIVGVVADEKFWRLDGELRPQAYVDIESQPPNDFDLLLRAADAEGVRSALRAGLAPVLPGTPLDNLRRIEDSARDTVQGRRLGVAVMDLLAVLALALTAIGVYGVMSSRVHERRHELAIRAALGAPPFVLVRTVVRDGLVLGAAGVLLGVLGSLVAGRFLAGYVYAVSPSNPLAMGLAGVLLLLLTLAAAWLPAQRAGRTAPAPVLRQV